MLLLLALGVTGSNVDPSLELYSENPGQSAGVYYTHASSCVFSCWT